MIALLIRSSSHIGSWRVCDKQLQLYNFRRLAGSPLDYNGYYHEYFLRHRPHLLSLVQRTKRKGTGVRGKTDPESEPDFYQMTFLTQMDSISTAQQDSFSASLKESTSSANRQTRDCRHVMDMKNDRASSSPSSLCARLQVLETPTATATSMVNTSPPTLLNFSWPQSVSSTEAHSNRNSQSLVSHNRHFAQTAAVSVTGESSSVRDSLSLSQNTVLSGLLPESDATEDFRDNPLEPTPLPPVYIRFQGDMDHVTEAVVPVARHPSFVQVEQNTFVFVDADSVE
jgi:hypothetical protein